MPSWDSWFGNSAPADKGVEVYQNMADGTHRLRYDQGVDAKGKLQGSPTDLGVVASKPDKALTDKPVIKSMADGSTWVFKFNPDGSVANSQQLAEPGGKPVDPSLSGERDARTQLIDQQLANAEAMAPYNLDKAKATIDNLKARTDLVPAQKDLIDARIQRIASQNSVDPSRIGLNVAKAGEADAHSSLYTIEGQMKLKNAFFQAQQEINTMQSMVGKPGGPPDQATADDLAKQIYARVAREAATGISATQEATNDLTAQRQAVDQGNNRSSSAASVYDRSLQTVGDIATKGAAPGQGGMLANGFLSLLNVANQNQNNMGGAPVQGRGMGNVPFTLDHAKQVAQLVMSGQAPADAQGNRFPAAVQMVGQQVGAVGGAPPNDGPRIGQPEGHPATTSFLPDVNPITADDTNNAYSSGRT